MPIMLRRTHRRRVAELTDYYERALSIERELARRLRGRIAELEMQLALRSPRPSTPGRPQGRTTGQDGYNAGDGYIHLRSD